MKIREAKIYNLSFCESCEPKNGLTTHPVSFGATVSELGINLS
jgi:hypothetical protein